MAYLSIFASLLVFAYVAARVRRTPRIEATIVATDEQAPEPYDDEEAERAADPETRLLRAIEVREAAFGPDHPQVADALSILAGHYQASGRLGEAEALLRRAYDV